MRTRPPKRPPKQSKGCWHDEVRCVLRTLRQDLRNRYMVPVMAVPEVLRRAEEGLGVHPVMAALGDDEDGRRDHGQGRLMSAMKVYYMRCDGCGFDDENSQDARAAAARREARASGWTHPRANTRSQMRIDLCPTCSEDQ